MPKLYFTMGLPRSGKSTFATEWAKQAPMRAIVNSDTIRLALSGQRYEPLAETMVFAIKHVMIRSLLQRGFDVMVDGTHSTEISMQRIFEIDINAIPLYFHTSKEICIERAKDTNQLDVIIAIKRIEENLQKIGFRNHYKGGPCKLPMLNEVFCVGEYACFDVIQDIRKKVCERNLYNEQSSYIPDYWWYGVDLSIKTPIDSLLNIGIDRNILCYDADAQYGELTNKLIKIMKKQAKELYKVTDDDIVRVYCSREIDEGIKFCDRYVPFEYVSNIVQLFKDKDACLQNNDDELLLIEYKNCLVMLGSF